MNSTPLANRKHIAVFGNMNSGKSSLVNALTGQEISIVSTVKGTTTDPVKKTMELIPYGPVVFIDTAGMNDVGELGRMRAEKSRDVLKETDFAIYVIDACERDTHNLEEMMKLFNRFTTPFLLVINKTDLVDKERLEELKRQNSGAMELSASMGIGIEALRKELAKRLQESEEDETLVGDLLPQGAKVILVVPVDSEAPKGRLILPQVQVIRDCLDHGIKSYVVRDTELESALLDIPDVDLVITDSQAFASVNTLVPDHIKLTSFSMILARQKGDFEAFLRGAECVDQLKPDAHILITESCTHNHTHEDIGRIKIPKLLNKYLGYDLQYDFYAGHDFPKKLEDYSLVIHCGACMINKKALTSRLFECLEAGIPVTNYGILLAKLTGVLERTVEAMRKF